MEFSTSNPLLQSIVENGVGGIAEVVWVLLSEGMKLERENHLGTASYRCSKTRTGHANGYKPRTIRNKFGKIRLDVPQVRDGGFYPSVLWQRCQFHIQRNAVVRVARKSMRPEIHRDIRNVFSMPSWAKRSRGCSGAPWRNTAGKGISCWRTGWSKGFTVYDIVEKDFARRRLRTTNMVEFQNKELKKGHE